MHGLFIHSFITIIGSCHIIIIIIPPCNLMIIIGKRFRADTGSIIGKRLRASNGFSNRRCCVESILAWIG